MLCTRACKILRGEEFVTDFDSGSRTAAHERTRSAMLVGVHAAYELRRIPCLRACVSGVGSAVQRCAQECRQDAWESRHAYSGERKASTRSWSCFPDELEAGRNQST